MTDARTEQVATDTHKIQIILDNIKLKKKWLKCTREQKIIILEGMDVATDFKWILNLFEDLTQ